MVAPFLLVEKMDPNIISWDEVFMSACTLFSMRSKDPKTKVGAVIVDRQTKVILGAGYNGLPRGIEDTDERWSDESKHNYVVHAETNALLNQNIPINSKGREKILYCTYHPCHHCAKLICQDNITEIVYSNDKFLRQETGQWASLLFQGKGVVVRQFSPSITINIAK